MGNRNSSLKEDLPKKKIDSTTRQSFRKNRKKIKKSITAPLTANGVSQQPVQEAVYSSEKGKSLPSTPNLSKHSPSTSIRSRLSPGQKLEVKIFRSYTRLNDSGQKRNIFEDPPTNIRIFKRSANNSELELNANNRMASRSYSLPRELCRNRTYRTSGMSTSTENFDNLSIKKTRRSVATSRSSTVSRLNSFSDPSSTAYRVKKSDFTNVETLKKKLSHFSKALSLFLTESFLALPQLTSLFPICDNPSSTFRQPPITIQQFLEAPEELTGILEANQFLLHVSKETFEDVKAIKKQKKLLSNLSQTPSLSLPQAPLPTSETICRALLERSVEELAWEACRVLEYQVCLLAGNLTLESLARCLSERVVSYVVHQMKSPLIDPNSLLSGLLRGKVHKPQQPPPVASVIIGMKELKWNLYDLMDKTGLRRDILLEHEVLEGLEPFTFHAASFSDPMLYGYRGVMMEWDGARGVYRQNAKERLTYDEEVLYRYDDFHRIYLPHFRSFGSLSFNRFTTGDPSKEQSTLLQSFKDAFKDTSYFLEDIAVVFYPTKCPILDTNIALQFNRYLRSGGGGDDDNGSKVSQKGSALSSDLHNNTQSGDRTPTNYSPRSIVTRITTYPSTSTPTSNKELSNRYHINIHFTTPPHLQPLLHPSQLNPQNPAQKPPLSPHRSQPASSQLSCQQQKQHLPPSQRLHSQQKPPPTLRSRSTLRSDDCDDILRRSRTPIQREHARPIFSSSDLLPVFKNTLEQQLLHNNHNNAGYKSINHNNTGYKSINHNNNFVDSYH